MLLYLIDLFQKLLYQLYLDSGLSPDEQKDDRDLLCSWMSLMLIVQSKPLIYYCLDRISLMCQQDDPLRRFGLERVLQSPI